MRLRLKSIDREVIDPRKIPPAITRKVVARATRRGLCFTTKHKYTRAREEQLIFCVTFVLRVLRGHSSFAVETRMSQAVALVGPIFRSWRERRRIGVRTAIAVTATGSVGETIAASAKASASGIAGIIL